MSQQGAAERLAQLDPKAPLAQRHLWLIRLMGWLRGRDASVPEVLQRMDALLDAAEADPSWQRRWTLWRARGLRELDVAALLADFGLASQPAFLTELGHRLRRKWLPLSPASTDMGDLFTLLFHDRRDSHWLRALPRRQLERLARLLTAPARPAQPPRTSDWEDVLTEALAICIGQISATGVRPDLRQRMSTEVRARRDFQRLPVLMDTLRETIRLHGCPSAATDDIAHTLRLGLEAARESAQSVYLHLESEGISVGMVFRLRQLRERIARAHALLDCLLSTDRERATARLLSQLVAVGHDNRSIRALISSSTELTAARVTERSAETGEQYITRDWPEYQRMLWRAGGGGALLGFTAWFKFIIGGWALSAFWGGLWTGLNYAIAFVLIQLLHFTVATKQPAVTAPAMVARLRDLHSRESVLRFVDEVAHLFRSQVAAIVGNLALVVPVVVLISTALSALSGQPMLSTDQARYVLEQHQLLGPSLLYAAFTGVLLFASSIMAGWIENSFVLHKLDTAIAHHPTWVRYLGESRSARWGQWLRRHISGLGANVSLGLMLGLLPPVAGFFGLHLEVRHVTLVMGQLTAAGMALGLEVWHSWAFWSALLTTALVGPINLGVSFYLAFRLALKSQGISDLNRLRIQTAIRHRLRRAPLSFVWPLRAQDHPSADDLQLPDPPAPDGPDQGDRGEYRPPFSM